jgi:hypothetical protein
LNKENGDVSIHIIYMIILVLVILLILIFIAFKTGFINRYNYGRLSTYQRRCSDKLRNLFEIQNKYFSENNEYGNWDELQEHGYLSLEVSPNNYIEFYYVELLVDSEEHLGGITQNSGVTNKFTIVAYPDIINKEYLSTFAISNDGILRFYSPSYDKDINNINGWPESAIY